MALKKTPLKAFIFGINTGFLIGGIAVFKSLKESSVYIKHHQYIRHQVLSLAGFHLQKPLWIWLKIALMSAGVFLALWLVGKICMSFFSENQFTKRFIPIIKRERLFKWAKPFIGLFLTLFFLLVFLNTAIFIESLMVSSKKPNVILITCETLRADHMGYQGYKKDTTPHIDSLAQQAFLFKNAYVQTPCTRPSMWNIITSKYQSSMPAKDHYLTMGEFFKSNHYKTGAFISQQFLKAEESNLHQGFDIYDDRSPKDKHGLSRRKAASITDQTLNWIQQNKNRSFFCWLVYFDPHDPYIPPDDYRGHYIKSEKYNRDRREEHIHMKAKPIPEEHREFLINAYDEEIRYFDHQVGRLLDNLKKLELYDNSIIIITSDHGEELGNNGNRWDHCQILSQEEIWVPLIIKMPGQQDKRVVNEAVQTIDIYPTLVDYLGKRPLPSFYITLEGKSLVPFLTKKRIDKDWWAAAFWQGQRCLIQGNQKYWLDKKNQYLIHIKTGQSIKDNSLLESMEKKLNNIYKRYIIKKDYYKETEKRLKSLGYIK